MAKDSKEISVEEALLLADEELKNLPKNKIKEYLPVIEKLKNSGKKWKEIAEFFETKIQLPVKTSHVKNVYFEAYPEIKKEKKINKE